MTQPYFLISEIKNSQKILFIFGRILALPAFLLAFLFLYDIYLAKPFTDTAVILRKSTMMVRLIETYKIRAKGKYTYISTIPKNIFEELDEGDKLSLELTPIFHFWRNAEISKGPNLILKFSASHYHFLFLLTLFFFLPLIFFIPNMDKKINSVPGMDNKIKSAPLILAFMGIGIVAIGMLIKYWELITLHFLK